MQGLAAGRDLAQAVDFIGAHCPDAGDAGEEEQEAAGAPPGRVARRPEPSPFRAGQGSGHTLGRVSLSPPHSEPQLASPHLLL